MNRRENHSSGNRPQQVETNDPGALSFGGRRPGPRSNEQAERERKRYKNIQAEVKRTIFVNACYCDEVRLEQDKLKAMEQERRFLLHRCMQFEVKARMDFKSKPSRSEIVSKSWHETHKKVVSKIGMLNKVKKQRQNRLSGNRLAQTVAVDSSGKPVYPIVLDNLTIHSLGEIQTENESFHTEEYIFPAGYCCTRIYANTDYPEKKCLYACKIVQADDGGPRFEISPEDRPDFVITGFSASECHRRLLTMINAACGTDVLNVSKSRGAEFFGFSHPTVHNLIQNSAGARKCRKYQFLKFETVSGGVEVAKFTDHAVALNYDALQRYPPFKGAMSNKRQSGMANASLRTLLTTT